MHAHAMDGVAGLVCVCACTRVFKVGRENLYVNREMEVGHEWESGGGERTACKCIQGRNK